MILYELIERRITFAPVAKCSAGAAIGLELTALDRVTGKVRLSRRHHSWRDDETAPIRT